MQQLLKKLAKIKLGVISIAVWLSLGLMSVASALDLSKIQHVYFFGDSLTDSGYMDLLAVNEGGQKQLPTHKAPTYTTFGGNIWAQYIIQDIMHNPFPTYPNTPPGSDTITNNKYGAGSLAPNIVSGLLTGNDYAAAGSGTDANGNVAFPPMYTPLTLGQQVQGYFTDHPGQAAPGTVFFVWSGSNDFLSKILSNNIAALANVPNIAPSNIVAQVKILSQAKPMAIVVLDLPNLGSTPLSQVLNRSTPGVAYQMQVLSSQFDSNLAHELGKANITSTKVMLFDVYFLLDKLLAELHQTVFRTNPITGNTLSFKFDHGNTEGGSVLSDIACGVPPPTPTLLDFSINCPPPAMPNGYDNYIFADLVHPSGKIHEMLALDVENYLATH